MIRTLVAAHGLRRASAMTQWDQDRWGRQARADTKTGTSKAAWKLAPDIVDFASSHHSIDDPADREGFRLIGGQLEINRNACLARASLRQGGVRTINLFGLPKNIFVET